MLSSQDTSVTPPGVAEVSWVSPQEWTGETWLVVLEGTPEAVPRAYRLDGSVLREQGGPLPFKSQVVTRFKTVARQRLLRPLKFFISAVAATLVGLLLLGFASGSFQLRLVLTGSMSGTFEPGDMLVVLSPRFFDIQEDSIIVFHYYDAERSTLVGDFSHRIIGGNAETGWETKGDANEVADLSPVFPQDVIGGVVGWVPNVGWLIQPSNLLALAMLVILSLVLGPEIRQLVSIRKRGR